MTPANGHWLNGVYFTEAKHPNNHVDGALLRVEISRQNSNLRAVKEKLAREVLRRGGNALVQFEYGQRSHSVLKQVFTFKWDTESWHGTGYAARLPITEDQNSD